MATIWESCNPNSISIGGAAPGAPAISDVWWDTAGRMWRWWDGMAWQTFAASIPATSTSSGLKGQMAMDMDFLYVCVDNNFWKRTPLTTW